MLRLHAWLHDREALAIVPLQTKAATRQSASWTASRKRRMHRSQWSCWRSESRCVKAWPSSLAGCRAPSLFDWWHCSDVCGKHRACGRSTPGCCRSAFVLGMQASLLRTRVCRCLQRRLLRRPSPRARRMRQTPWTGSKLPCGI